MPILDSILRSVGISGPVEIGEAERERRQMESSEALQDIFASKVADALSGCTTGEALRTFRSLEDVKFGTAPDVRWMAIATEAKELAESRLRTPQPGLDGALSHATAERGIVEASRMLDTQPHERPDGMSRTIEGILDDRIGLVTRQVRGFMSTGRHAEKNAEMLTRSMIATTGQPGSTTLLQDVREFVGSPTPETRREWLAQANRARLAMAQTGVLSAGRTVAEAMDASTHGHLQEGSIAQVRNRHAAEQSTGSKRIALVVGRMEMNGQYQANGIPKALSPEQNLALRGIAPMTPEMQAELARQAAERQR